MKLSELMQGVVPDVAFAGVVTNDDNVLAVDISPKQDAAVEDYVIVQTGVEGLDSQMNPITQDKQYIRTGLVTTKTGNQRTFSINGDRFVGDDFQDFAFDPSVKYGVGEIVKVNYVYFCLLNGLGETGQVSVIANTDGSGNAGETAAIDVELKSTKAPVEYIFSQNDVLGTLTVTSAEGAAVGETLVTVKPNLPVGMTAYYKTGATIVLPSLDDPISTPAWKAFSSGTEYTATNGQDFAVVYTDIDDKAKFVGKADAVVKA